MLQNPDFRPHVYANSPLDRVSERRKDAAWLEAALASRDAMFVPVWRSQSLLRGVEGGAPQAVYLSGESAQPWLAAGEAASWVLLGLLGETPVFALDAAEPHTGLPQGSGFYDLRRNGRGIDPKDAAILAHARALIYWRSQNRFCGVCGNTCRPDHAGNALVCTGCGTHHFPRTDPAVIMLVTDGSRALLGRSQRFPTVTMYSTLAGFVEPGESLEEAVRREVFEETGIKVGRVRYHSSQPWPFPASIMLGFHAEALNDTITVDYGELVDAAWFSREQMRAPKDHGFDLPPPDSIARRLINDWIEFG